MKFPKLKINKGKFLSFLIKTLLLIAKHAFFACLVIFFSSLFLGAFLFYRYNIMFTALNFEGVEEPFFLERGSYQKVVNKWKEDENKFLEADLKEYINPFERGLTEQ